MARTSTKHSHAHVSISALKPILQDFSRLCPTRPPVALSYLGFKSEQGHAKKLVFLAVTETEPGSTQVLSAIAAIGLGTGACSPLSGMVGTGRRLFITAWLREEFAADGDAGISVWGGWQMPAFLAWLS